MKSISVVLLLACLGMSMGAFSQNITIDEKNISLEKVFSLIKKQTGYTFWYKLELLNQAKKINITVKDASLKEVLDKCFLNQPFTYEIIEKTVVIKAKTENNKTASINIAQFIDVRGRVLNDKGDPVEGVTLKIKGTEKNTATSMQGTFSITAVEPDATLVLTHVSMEPAEITINGRSELSINLKTKVGALDDVVVTLSTGYQDIPRERATGAFSQVDTKTIQRSIGINVLDRLEGVTSGLLLNRNLINGANNAKLSVRGRSTILANPEPLIVLDGFPYEGKMEQINPADVESITVLKDAAAASIWGTRAGNGVIVITSKKGKKNQKLTVGLNSTVTVWNKPDLYYRDQLSASEFIDVEAFLFSKGFYTASFNTPYSTVSPAVEIFNRRKNNLISAADSAAQIDALKGYDIRKQLEQYAYRAAVYQQYQLNVSGGNEVNRFYVSGGYDKNTESSVTNKYDRFTLHANNTYTIWKDRLDISADIHIAAGNTYTRASSYVPYTPYDRIADEQGNSLPVTMSTMFRQSYLDTAGGGKLLDWSYRPKDELKPNNIARQLQSRITLGIAYKIMEGLSLHLNYQYLRENNDQEQDYDLDSYYARDRINRYSSISGGIVTRNIPLGSIFSKSFTTLTSQIFRAMVSYNKTLANDHTINAIAGYEGGDTRSNSESITLYGYDAATKTNGNNTINPLALYPFYYEPGLVGMIQTAPSLLGRVNITQSYYANLAYTYKNKYIASGSARKDESNLFGVKSNQKGVPLWSAGLAWIINRESFYHLQALPSLKLRATYGYNGNVDKTISGLLTVFITGLNNEWGSPYSRIANPPNPSLRWEKVRTWNIALDFSGKNNRISGSIDLYQKYAIDLIGNNPIAMQSGVTVFKGNGANLRSNGIDLILNTRNIIGPFQWTTSLLLNYNTDKVTSYKIKQASNSGIIADNYKNPSEGYPYYAIFSFPSAGLDTAGLPQGYLNKTVSKDYAKILSTLDPAQLKYHGSASPRFFGNMINTFGYERFELSFNLVYKFDYYFRRTNVFNGFLADYTSKASDYNKRWQKKGDELITRIPAFVYPDNTARNNFFQYSEDLIEKGDHIRLQDIRLSYGWLPKQGSQFIRNINFFLFARNIGILWKANDAGVDPDYGPFGMPQPFSASAGINLNF